MEVEATTIQKIDELVCLLKEKGLWKNSEPAWVKEFNTNADTVAMEFFEWLQFVYLPNRLVKKSVLSQDRRRPLTLQAKTFATETLKDRQMLRLLVELDAL